MGMLCDALSGRLAELACRINAAVVTASDVRSRLKGIEDALRCFVFRERRTFRQRFPERLVPAPTGWASLVTRMVFTASVCVGLLLSVAIALSAAGTLIVGDDASPGDTLLTYAELSAGMVGLMFAVVVFAAERAVERLGRCTFLIRYILKESRVPESAGVSVGIILVLAVVGLLPDFHGLRPIACGALILAIPALVILAGLMLYLLYEAFRLAAGDPLYSRIAQLVATDHALWLRHNLQTRRRRERFKAEFERLGGVYSPLVSSLYRSSNVIAVSLPPEMHLVDFDLHGLERLICDLRQHWPEAVIVMDTWSGNELSAPTEVLLSPGGRDPESARRIDSSVRAAFSRRAGNLFVLRSQNARTTSESDLARVIKALPHIAREDSTESFGSVLELLERCADAELNLGLAGAPGRLLDWWEHRQWRDVDDAVLEMNSRSKLELYWSFLEHVRYAAASADSPQQLAEVLVMQRGLVYTAGRGSSPHAEWLSGSIDDSLAYPSMMTGISGYRSLSDESSPPGASDRMRHYVRHCLELSGWYHQHQRVDDARNITTRLVEYFVDLVGHRYPANDNIPVMAMRYLTLGVVLLLGWGVWNLKRKDDAFAAWLVDQLREVHFDFDLILDAWCLTPDPDNGAGLIEYAYGWENPEKPRTGVVSVHSGPEFPYLGFATALLMSHRYGTPIRAFTEDQLSPVRSDRLNAIWKGMESEKRIERLFNGSSLASESTRIEQLLKTLRRASAIRDVESVLARTVSQKSIDIVRLTIRKKLLSGYRKSNLIRQVDALARRHPEGSRVRAVEFAFRVLITKKDLLGENLGPEQAATHGVGSPEHVFAEIVSAQLRDRFSTPLSFDFGPDSRTHLQKRIVEERSNGNKPAAIVHGRDEDVLKWLGGENYWSKSTNTMEPYEATAFEGVPVIALPGWADDELMLLTEEHVGRTDLEEIGVSVTVVADNCNAVRAELERAKSEDGVEVPSRFSPAFQFQVTVQFPFSFTELRGEYCYQLTSLPSASAGEPT
jgi:hypothetical protein